MWPLVEYWRDAALHSHYSCRSRLLRGSRKSSTGGNIARENCWLVSRMWCVQILHYKCIQCAWIVGVDQFLGLEFASSKRWEPPEDRKAPYEQPYAATAQGPSCPQWPGQIYNATFTSENCLTLNVWTPSSRSANAAPLLVLVWIYGGGLAFGGSSVFNGSTLASKHASVVVAMNYRPLESDTGL